MPNDIYSSKKVLPYVYWGTHRITKEYYIGYREANKVPSSQDLGYFYFSSSRNIRPRFHEFDWIVLAEFFEGKDAYEFEQLLIAEHIKNPLNLNKRLWAKYVGGSKHSKETKAKMRQKALGRYHTEETKNKTRGENHYSNREDFVPQTAERNGMFGKCGELHVFFGQTKHTHPGLARTSEKLSGENNPRYGKPGTMTNKKHSEEARQKIGQRPYATGKNHICAKTVWIGNIKYDTIMECVEETGLSKSFIRRLLKTPNNISKVGPCQKLFKFILEYQNFQSRM